MTAAAAAAVATTASASSGAMATGSAIRPRRRREARDGGSATAGARASSAASRVASCASSFMGDPRWMRWIIASTVRSLQHRGAVHPCGDARDHRRVPGPMWHDRSGGDPMVISAQAGRPAEPEQLVDLDALVAAYYDLQPDPRD